ncbi:hypothetical protein ACA040_000956 [Xenophilus aerolatus]
MTIYEACLAYGPTYGQALTGYNFDGGQFDWFYALFTPLADVVYAYGAKPEEKSGAGASQVIAALGWGVNENFKNLWDTKALSKIGVDRQGAGILPRATESFSADQLKLVTQARRYKQAGNSASFGKTYKYLSDPELRRKETGDQEMVVKGALFSGARFQYLTWRNIKFVDCDFAGAYEIKLDAMENCSFESCKIVGIHGFGTMRNVQFYKCLSGGASVWGGGEESTNVRFEECQFIGDTSDRNHQGGIGTYGEAAFINCKVKWFALTGDAKLVVRGCECEDVRVTLSGEGLAASVLVENSKLRGEFRMIPARLQSLTIRDTQIDLLDLTGASVKGDVVMERVKGGVLKVGVRDARSLTLRDSQIYGAADNFNPRVFSMAADSVDQLLIDNVQFASGLQDVVKIGNTGPLTESQWSAVPQAAKTVRVFEVVVLLAKGFDVGFAHGAASGE